MKKVLAFCLSIMIVMACCFTEPMSAMVYVKTSYQQELLNAGFPDSYIPMLAKLHSLHPEWKFVPHVITDYNSNFTWEYVIDQMMSYPSRNLVVKSTWAPSPFTSLGDANYAPYRNESGGTYDSGNFYLANEEAVRYFMDPRNFLNDVDCFMFLDWSYTEGNITEEQVEKVLGKSAFAQTIIPDYDGTTTYAGYILQVGTQLQVDPLFLASRLVQENGTGTSPMVQGTTGDFLGDESYNGYYNFYNIKAGGTGLTAIYTNGINEAISGTPDMAEEWGGSPSWDTRWKAIYGGIYKIRNAYVLQYRNTLYMQKFNTDPRANLTFSGYMQNIAAPLTEGRTFRKAIYETDCLESAYTFTIPVYKGMPTLPEADPGGGRVLYSYSKAPETKYSVLGYYNNLDIGSNSGTMMNAAATVSFTYTEDNAPQDFSLRGWSVHEDGVWGYYYTIDGFAPQIPIPTENRQDVFDNGFAEYSPYCTADNVGFSGTIDLTKMPTGTHKIRVFAHTDAETTYHVATVTVTIEGPLGYRCYIDGQSDFPSFNKEATADITLSQVGMNEIEIRGWSVHESGVNGFYYRLDDKEPVALPAENRYVELTERVPDFIYLCASKKIGYCGTLSTDELTAGQHTLTVYGQCKETDEEYVAAVYSINVPTIVLDVQKSEANISVAADIYTDTENVHSFAVRYEDGRMTAIESMPGAQRLRYDADLSQGSGDDYRVFFLREDLTPLCDPWHEF